MITTSMIITMTMTMTTTTTTTTTTTATYYYDYIIICIITSFLIINRPDCAGDSLGPESHHVANLPSPVVCMHVCIYIYTY